MTAHTSQYVPHTWRGSAKRRGHGLDLLHFAVYQERDYHGSCLLRPESLEIIHGERFVPLTVTPRLEQQMRGPRGFVTQGP